MQKEKVEPGRIQAGPGGKLLVPNRPVIPYIQGDGIGVDIWPAARRVLDEAVCRAYRGKREIRWLQVFAGEEALGRFGTPLPEDTLTALRRYRVGIKGPLTTPVGSGIRSLNVALRQALDLYACIRPVTYIPGVPCPIRRPERVNLVIFRENTEDVYAGIEWRKGSAEATRVIRFLNREVLAGTGKSLRGDSGIGIKPVSLRASQRIVRKAIEHALREGCPSVTLVHKGNIMKYTEGAFREWGYALARKEFAGKVRLAGEAGGGAGGGAAARVLLKDQIADAMFQQVLLRPEDYSVICTLNLNGDYLSDACAAMVGGLGMAPGGNIGDGRALFEATHGTAPKYAGQDKVNPSSLILSGEAMLSYLGWPEAARMIRRAVTRTIRQKRVTYDLERQMKEEGTRGVKLLKCSEFAEAVCANMEE
ncbi:MAG: isocitrate dehydrogenase (NADP(+)) [bacterium]